MAYEMKDLSYREYLKFCEAEGIQTVPLEEYCKVDFLRKFLTDNQIPNAIFDHYGMTVTEHQNFYDPSDARFKPIDPELWWPSKPLTSSAHSSES